MNQVVLNSSQIGHLHESAPEFSLLVSGCRELVNSHIQDRFKRLEMLCKRFGVSALNATNRDFMVKNTGVVLVAGAFSKVELLTKCEFLRANFRTVILAIDAIEVLDADKLEVSSQLEEAGIQLALTEAVGFLLSSASRFVYAYAKADVSCSVAVIYQASRKVVLVRRAREPFKGQYCLPGGFLRPLLEELPACASRELFEETGLKLPEHMFRLVDVRSKIDRDNRGHVIDHGYLCMIPWRIERALPERLEGGDDADDVQVVPLVDALKLPLAADHNQLLLAAAKLLPKNYFLEREFSLRRQHLNWKTSEIFTRIAKLVSA